MIESYDPNGQLSLNFPTKNSKEIMQPQETYGIFYWRIFGVRKYANFLSTLQYEFKAQLEFLTELGIKELAKDDEILCEESFKSDSVRLNCRSYDKNGHLKFEYTFENAQGPYLDSGVETFELFYEDAQPKFRFEYEIDEIDGVAGSYKAFYDNGQLKAGGNL
jgi:antitoxin component YwqK of YwqJK toxin-antitoxin module